MELIVTAKVIARGEIRSGVSSQGNEWKAVEYTLEETTGRYPGRVCFSIFGKDRVERIVPLIHRDTVVTVHIDVNAREYQGRWFNELRAYKLILDGQDLMNSEQNATATAPQPTAQTQAYQPQQQPQAQQPMNTAPTNIPYEEALPF